MDFFNFESLVRRQGSTPPGAALLLKKKNPHPCNIPWVRNVIKLNYKP